MRMIERAMAVAQSRRGADCRKHVIARARHRRDQAQPLRQPRGNGRRQGAAGAGGVARVDAGGVEQPATS